MALALVAFQAYGMESDEAVTKKFVQFLRLDITAANTDVDIDVGDYSGTFWTAVGATAPGINALKTVKDIQTRAKQMIAVGGQALATYPRVATPGAGEYSVAMDATNTHLPNVLFHSGDAPTAYSIYISWDLTDQAYPIYLQG